MPFNRNSLAQVLKHQELINNPVIPNPSVPIEDEEEPTAREKFNSIVEKINRKKNKKKNRKEAVKDMLILIDEMYPPEQVNENEIFYD